MSISGAAHQQNVWRMAILFTILGGLFLWAPSSQAAKPVAQKSKPAVAQDQLLVKIAEPARAKVHGNNPHDTGLPSVDAILSKHKVTKFEAVVKPGKKSKSAAAIFAWYRLTLDPAQVQVKVQRNGVTVDQRLEALKSSLTHDPAVADVEYNYTVHSDLVPNDPFYSTSGSWGQSFGDLWGLKKINAATAWDTTTGSANVLIADIDTGLDLTHPDISDNIWTNTAEIPANGIDDDGNGYIDDVHGWNWVSSNANVTDDNGHGTHTAGTIAAIGNNGSGIVGVAWNSKLMPLKFLDSNGSGPIDSGAKALIYAADMGARISSNSWGCTCNSQALDDALQYEHDRNMVAVVAAGNDYGSDALDNSPAGVDGAITVGATDSNNAIANFSNIGSRIDVVAPGVDILSLKSAVSPVCSGTKIVAMSYCVLSGTSMATPHVSGLAALLIARNPALSNEQVRQLLRTNAGDLGTIGRDQTFGYGLIDAAKTTTAAAVAPVSAYISSPRSHTQLGTQALPVIGSISGPNLRDYKVELGLGRNPTNLTVLASGTVQVSNGTLATVDPSALADGSYTLRITATDTTGKAYLYEQYDLMVDNVQSDLLSPLNVLSIGSTDITGTVSAKNGLAVASYSLAYGTGANPTTYTSTGLTTTGAMNTANARLGTWNTANLTDGTLYTLQLKVTLTNGAISTTNLVLKADKTLVNGWPKYIPASSCTSCDGTPVMVDLNGDGKKELVTATPGSNQIIAYNKNGSVAAGFPVTVAQGDWFKWPLSASDVNNDGKPEIIAPAITSSGATRIYLLNTDGTFLAGWPNPVYSSANGGSLDDISPTVADLDGDGQKELVTHETYWPDTGYIIHRLHAVHSDGTEIAGFPKDIPVQNSFLQYRLTIADLNKDGKPEIAFGDYDKFYVLNNQGVLLPGWPFTTPTVNGNQVMFQSPAAVGDIDGDGQLEIFSIATPNGALGVQLPLFGWKLDGTQLPGWPQMTGQYGMYHVGWPLNNIATADVNNDGKSEVMVGANNFTIHTLTGQLPVTPTIGSGSVTALDTTGDGVPEFSAGQWRGDTALQTITSNGTLLWNASNITSGSFYDPFVSADMDNNGKFEYAGVLNLNDQPGSLVYMWELPGNSYPKDDWPMFGHDGGQTNNFQNGIRKAADNTAPTVALTSPANNTTVSGNVALTATAADNIGVTSVEFSVDGTVVATDTTAPYTGSWNSLASTNGTHTITARAYDAAGNSTASTVNVTLNNPDTTIPVVSLSAPQNGTTVSGTVSINANASDNVGVTKVVFSVDGATVATDTTAPYSTPWNTTSIANGSHTITAKAYDAANNTTSATVTVTVRNIDLGAPSVAITAPANNAQVSKNSNLTISATASDDIGVTKVEFYVNGALQCTDTTAAYSCTYKIGPKAGTSYTILVKAYDAAGNVSNTTVTVVAK
jgi:subtilisin family serine protease